VKKMKKNFQWNATISNREAVMWIGLLFFLLIFGTKQWLVPFTSELHTLQGQLETKKLELAKLGKVVQPQGSDSKQDSINMSQHLILDKVKEFFERPNTVPDVIVSELMSQLTSPENAKDAMLDKFAFAGETKQNGLNEMKFDMKLVGSYEGITNYLSMVKKLPYLIKLTSIDLKPQNPEVPEKLEFFAKSVLYVGTPSATNRVSGEVSQSDVATNLLMELNGSKSSRTPFSAKSKETAGWSLNELKLTSTMAGCHRATALINGHIFELGDEIADFKVSEIRPQEVVLKRGELSYVLKISEQPWSSTQGAENTEVENTQAPKIPESQKSSREENIKESPPAEEPSEDPSPKKEVALSGGENPQAIQAPPPQEGPGDQQLAVSN
jgi:Tfp pilus assembly protein PilO